jgi:transcription initiation factor TFIIIB Brf1 subunit/transcription initiation factor TFIIB
MEAVMKPKVNLRIINSNAVTTVLSQDLVEDDPTLSNKVSEYSHAIVRTNRTILADLKQYNFPDDIKNKANMIFNTMTYRVRRKKNRQQLLFYCIYTAHLELGKDVNPISLGKEFGLTNGQVQKTDSMFSPLQTGYQPPSTVITPMKYLPSYCEKMGLSKECTNDVISLAKSIMDREPALYQDSPQTVASGIFRYYLSINGIQCDPNIVSNITDRSSVTIDAMYRRISMIDNM